MAIPDTETLNSAIKAAGAGWAAADSSGTPRALGLAMTPEQALPALLAARASEAMKAQAFAATALPSAVDWRRHNGSNWITPVRDQQSCGSCVAFATVAAIEARVLIAQNRPGVDFDLSEANLFYCGTPNSCALGWQPPSALAYAQSPGLGREAAFPYTPGNQPCRNVPVVVNSGPPRAAASMAARKSAVNDGPVIACFAVYEDFFNYGSGVYRHVTGGLAGYHAVCIVGYDDAAGCWIAKNSWGPFWGEAGFFRIHYGECGIDSQFVFDYTDSVTLTPGTTVP